MLYSQTDKQVLLHSCKREVKIENVEFTNLINYIICEWLPQNGGESLVTRYRGPLAIPLSALKPIMPQEPSETVRFFSSQYQGQNDFLF